MALVEEFYNGPCHIKIYDDSCKNVTQEEIDATLKRIGDLYYRSQVRKKLMEQNEKEKREGGR
nr:MAG TPA: hypothetical protein [Caudoviricetes sp.]